MSLNNKISFTQDQVVLQDQLRLHRNRYRNQKGDSSGDCVGDDGVGVVMTMIQQSYAILSS